ncbi:hypothetical protein [Georgenia alba]|uniref:Alpha/beta hydrolase n=1 Tax=Georgenia alba TaxID=2233858 RepID=A0ABW2QHC6_9MICO
MTQGEQVAGAQGDGLIDPARFVARSGDLSIERITEVSEAMRRAGRRTVRHMQTVQVSWSGLRTHYEAPEQHQVHSLMEPAVRTSEEMHRRLGSAATHLETYARTLATIKPDLADLERRAAAFRARVAGGVTVGASEAKDAGVVDHLQAAFDWVPFVEEDRVTVPWYEDTATVEENTRLLGQYGALLSRISLAATTCANDINSLISGERAPVAEPLPAPAFTDAALPMPWGHPREEDRSCIESAGHTATNGFRVLTRAGGTALLGYDPVTGRFFDDAAYGRFWGTTFDLTVSIVRAFGPGEIDSLDDIPRELGEQLPVDGLTFGLLGLVGFGAGRALAGVADHRADRTKVKDVTGLARTAGVPEGTTPTGPADLYDDLDEVYGVRGAVRVQTITRADGTELAVVQVPGTQTWSPAPGQDPFGPYGAAASAAGKDSPQRAAVLEALRQAQVDAGTPVVMVGHSQGGFTVMDLAADPDVRRTYDIRSVVTAGAGGGQFDLPDEVTHISVRNPDDPVARLVGPRDGDVTVSGTWEGDHPHASKKYAELLRGSDDPALRRWWQSLGVDERARVEDTIYQGSVD